MTIYYDFHIHSGLSPCGDNEMTPNNIVNIAKLYDLDVIALTDHNSTLNCKAVMEAGKEIGLLVIPGMELCTSEEVHLVCLFPDLESATKLRCPYRPKRQLLRGHHFVLSQTRLWLFAYSLIFSA